MNSDVFDEHLAELHAFIEDNKEKIKVVIEQAPVSYGVKNSSELYSKGWSVGFRRCLAELKRIADKDLKGE